MTGHAQPETAKFSGPLLAWYRTNKRSLPWRDASHDPYAVWISEVMLQQTTVAAVIPYFERWMAAFPTVAALAAADTQDVLRRWAGLGYYARARNIKKAAEQIVALHDGRVPDSVESLLELPGIGRYTAGAIASIAFGLPAPIVDANVTRILSRIYAVDGDVQAASTRAQLWKLAENALPIGSASDFNQAMMELGAVVCTASAPKCDTCPVSLHCCAVQAGDVGSYPRSSKVTTWQNVADCCVAIERDGTLLFIRRPESGIWGGLWELPRETARPGEPLQDCARRAIADHFGGDIALFGEFGSWKHTVMNRRILLHGFMASVDGSGLDAVTQAVNRASTLEWHTPESALSKLPLPAPQTEILRIWLNNRLRPRQCIE